MTMRITTKGGAVYSLEYRDFAVSAAPASASAAMAVRTILQRRRRP